MKTSNTLKTLSDSELYRKAQKYGSNTLMWKRKFTGLLPEIYSRGLYRKHGIASIHEFAAKLAGMSQVSVDRILRLSKKLKDKPALKAQLETGAQGWSKIEKVACIATPETDEKWAGKVEILSLHALGAYVQGMRKNVVDDILKNKEKSTQESERENPEQIQQWEKITFNVSPETKQMLRIFKEEHGCLTLDEALQKLLKNEQNKKAKITIQVCPDCAEKKAEKLTNSRHIPVDVRRMIYAKYKGVCAFPGCKHAATSLHHTKRFALYPKHEHIVPLCDGHEQLAHAGLIANEDGPPENWKLLERPNIEDPKFHIDQSVTHHRRG